jgi:hypothetical protein
VQLTQVVGAPVNTITYEGGLYEAADYTDVIYEVSYAGFVLMFVFICYNTLGTCVSLV